ncbi:MAG: hypothetical protein JXA20_01730, partial [Spirochaetes bacterium]|nr:hypothetical protein [Spirochaetota bacterium]
CRAWLQYGRDLSWKRDMLRRLLAADTGVLVTDETRERVRSLFRGLPAVPPRDHFFRGLVKILRPEN